jgi:hypothetical protein
MNNSIDEYVAARLAEHYARAQLREAEKAERSYYWQKVRLE